MSVDESTAIFLEEVGEQLENVAEHLADVRRDIEAGDITSAADAADSFDGFFKAVANLELTISQEEEWEGEGS